MAKYNLENEHPLFTNKKDKYFLWESLVKGGDKIEQQDRYLPQHPYESDDHYAKRKERSVYVNLAKPIVSLYVSSIFRKLPVRRFDNSSIEPFIEDVDRQGTHADDFFYDVAKCAATYGVSFVLVDAPSTNENLMTRAESDAAGIRPYFTLLNPLQITDWQYEEDYSGKLKLKYVVIREEIETRLAEPFVARKTEFVYKVWTDKSWTVFKNNAEGGEVVIAEGEHNLGRVPIIPFYFDKDKELVGNSSISEVDSLLLKHYWNSVELDSTLFYSSIPLFFLSGFSKQEKESFVQSPGNAVSSQNLLGNSDLKVVEPKGYSVGSLNTQIQQIEKQINEIALRMFKPQTVSGERQAFASKRLDSEQLFSKLALFALNCSRAEQKCWDLMLEWMNETSEITVSYNMNFDYQMLLNSNIMQTISMVYKDGAYPRELFFYYLKRVDLVPEDMEYEDFKAMLEDDSRLAAPGLFNMNLSNLETTNGADSTEKA